MAEHLLDRDDELPGSELALDGAVFYGSAEAVDGAVVLRLAGELDMAAAPWLRRTMNAALNSGSSLVVLDLAELAFLDSTGIHVLMSAHGRAAGQGCSFVIRSPSRPVLKVLRLTGVDELMVIEPGPSRT